MALSWPSSSFCIVSPTLASRASNCSSLTAARNCCCGSDRSRLPHVSVIRCDGEANPPPAAPCPLCDASIDAGCRERMSAWISERTERVLVSMILSLPAHHVPALVVVRCAGPGLKALGHQAAHREAPIVTSIMAIACSAGNTRSSPPSPPPSPFTPPIITNSRRILSQSLPRARIPAGAPHTHT